MKIFCLASHLISLMNEVQVDLVILTGPLCVVLNAVLGLHQIFVHEMESPTTTINSGKQGRYVLLDADGVRLHSLHSLGELRQWSSVEITRCVEALTGEDEGWALIMMTCRIALPDLRFEVVLDQGYSWANTGEVLPLLIRRWQFKVVLLCLILETVEGFETISGMAKFLRSMWGLPCPDSLMVYICLIGGRRGIDRSQIETQART